MTQADLVRLYFANGESHSTWTYCFNQQCPLAQQCARYLSVTYKDPEHTIGYAVFPDAYHDNKCEHFLQLQLMKMAYGFEKLLEEYEGTMLSEQELSKHGFNGGRSIEVPCCNNKELIGYIKSIF